jgi:DNA-binding NtrC family response regulator
VLVVDEDEEALSILRGAVGPQGGRLHITPSPAVALDLLREASFDLVIANSSLPGISGLLLLREIRRTYPSLPFLLMSSHPTVEEAVEAMRLGAVDYVGKPLCPQRLSLLLNRLSAGKRGRAVTDLLIAASPAMQQIFQIITRVAATDATVFITGESGTGKEVVAQALHQLSKRREKSYVRVNCAAVPDTLLESEFFGHEKGAFTGAHARKMGRFESANGGTLLLDEVTEIPTTLQPKLLRALQEREFERVGGTQPLQVDVRVVATSNRNLEQALRTGLLREDLYYRLNVIPLHLPPLRDRREDILPLARHFLAGEKQLADEAAAALLAHDWPGNVRELANVIQRSSILADQEVIRELRF